MENKTPQTIEGLFFEVREAVKTARKTNEIRLIYDDEIGLWEELESRGKKENCNHKELH